jgi:hypothetical protein
MKQIIIIENSDSHSESQLKQAKNSLIPIGRAKCCSFVKRIIGRLIKKMKPMRESPCSVEHWNCLAAP